MIAFRIIMRCLCAVASTAVVHAQAAVEYAAKSASGALSGDASAIHVGVCRLDSNLVPCVKHFYPTTFYVAIIASCIVLGVLMYPKRRI
jgi:hypothetical protein